MPVPFSETAPRGQQNAATVPHVIFEYRGGSALHHNHR